MLQTQSQIAGEPQQDQKGSSLPSEDYVTRTMPPILGKFDMTATYVMALFLLTNAVVGASGGPVSLLYLGLGALVFFLPCVVATAQLGVMLPLEGSLYHWTQKALGDFWGFFIGLCYWLTGVLAVITAGDALVTTLQGLNNAWLNAPWQQGLVILAILAFSGIVGVQRFRTTQNIINGIFVLTCLVVALVGLAALVWLVTGHTSATNFADPTGWNVNPGNFSLFGIITLNFIGASGPLNMAGEIQGQGNDQRLLRKIITTHLFRGTIIVIAFYFVVSLSVLIVRGQQGMFSATVLPYEAFTAVSMTLGKVAGLIAVICFLSYCVAAAIFYTYASARILMVAGIDNRIPIWFSRLNRQRVPGNAVFFHILFGALVTIVVFILAPAVANLGGNAATTLVDIYSVMSASTVLIWTIATTFFFVDILFLYRQNPRRFRLQRLFPMPVIWVSVLVGTAACLMTIGGVLYYSWIPSLISNGQWWYIVGGLALASLVIAGLMSMYATSQATWEELNR